MFWIAFRGDLNRAYALVTNAREKYHAAGGDKLSLGLAIGTKRDISIELLEARENLTKCEAILESVTRQRRHCFLATPGVIAIILLFV